MGPVLPLDQVQQAHEMMEGCARVPRKLVLGVSP